MKNINKVLFAVILSWLFIFTAFYFFTPKKIAYVETGKILTEYKGALSAQEKIKVKQESLQSGLDSLMSEWQKSLQEFEKNKTKMSLREKELSQELISTKQEQINNFQQAIQYQLQNEDKKVTQTIFNQINEYIEQYGKEKGYKYILGATGGGNIVYAEKSQNITEEIISGLNKNYVED